MITACADVGYPEKARSMMRRMRDDGHVPDRDTYNWAIVACGENGDWETALELLDEMRREGLRPDLYSYQMAMKVSRCKMLSTNPVSSRLCERCVLPRSAVWGQTNSSSSAA